MNLDQQLLNLRNTIRLIEQATAGVDAAEPAITAAMRAIAAIVRDLPDGLLREQAWQRARPQVMAALEHAATVLGKQTYLRMALATPEQAAWAAAYIATPGPGTQTLETRYGPQTVSTPGYMFSSDAPGAAAARRAVALASGANPAYMPRTVEAFAGLTFTTKDLKGAGSSPDLLGKLQQRVPDDIRRLVEQTRITGFTLREWFGDSVMLQDEVTGRFVRNQGLGGRAVVGQGRTSRWATFGFTSIDRQVRAGFLGQVSTEEIARNLIFDEIRGRQRLGTGAVRLKSDARAIARTALMDLSDQAHMAQWQAMEQELGQPLVLLMRWDASLDSRTCSVCSVELDGREFARDQVPARPHPNCRCAILPVSATELELRRTGDSLTQRERVTAVEFTNQAPPDQRPNETRAQYLERMSDGGWFLTKGRGPSGERWYRRRVEREGSSVTDWLGEMARADKGKTSAAVSLQEYFGGNDAGAQRAEYFRRKVVDQKADPRDALNQMMRNIGGNPNQASWITVEQLKREMPQLAEVEAIASARQQREIRKAVKAAPGRRRPGLSELPRPRRGY